MQRKHVTKEEIDQFLNGSNPMERIIKLEIDYNEDKVHIFYRDEKGVKKCQIEPFYPFVWAKQSAARCLFNGNRKKIKDALNEYGIACKGLIIDDLEGNIHPRMENGYRVLFYAKIPMSFSKFMQFFIDGGRPIYPKQDDLNYNLRDYIVVAPNEQHMISTGKRLFKGYNDYDDLIRMQWDLETEGLTPETDMISQIGIRTNKGFEKIICIDGQTREEKGEKELEGMAEFFQTIKDIDPDVITGYNTENFDWNFEDVRLKKHNSSLLEFTAPYFNGKGIYKKKKQSVLKLGGEMEYYYPTIKYGTNITDGLFSVRRAQAIDSNMKKADLKYITKYSKLNKPNRVYVPGKIINSTWVETDKPYAFNNTNGHWFKITDKLLEKTYEIEKSKDEQDLDNFLNFDNNNVSQKIKSKLYTLTNNTLLNNQTGESFEIKNGRYIVERYLLDDLWETDKVELRYNQPNFLVGKMLPVSFEKMCTMGTAAIWKYIMLAWSYEHDLAIPELIETRKFVGGLSRLLSVGYVDRIVKLDYNSLYPSIILSYGIKSPIDISGVMNALLEYILTQREHYKELKGEYSKKAKKIKKKIEENPNIENKEALIKEQLQYEAEAARNDKMQLPLKITGNGFFGSYGSGSVFPHSDIECAEMTTCIGRMCLRLMISHFNKLGYKPIVGDSFSGDTPLFIKYNDTNLIDIKPISELIDENKINIDAIGREYDYSKKNFKVLCRSGWVEPSYIYRHECKKSIYRVSENSMIVDVTEDHSLFNENQEKIKPTEINNETKLEYYTKDISNNINPKTFQELINLCNKTVENNYQSIPIEILNTNKITKRIFANLLLNKINHKLYDYNMSKINLDNFSKTFIAGLNFIMK